MQTLTVTQFLEVLNESLAAIAPSGAFEIEGEVSSFNISQEKWVRFDLKDGESLINCFVSVWQLTEHLADGMKIVVTGYPKVYLKFGKLILNVQTMRLSGEGSLKQAFELLQKKLCSEGLFDVARKRALPPFPERIAIVTSRDAAAYTDFLRVASMRWPLAQIELFHASVQGGTAPVELIRALQAAQDVEPDVIVLTRGGGSLEELHAFNTEEVARTIFASRIPVVSAVGHERDITIADYVADVRAATPSNAGELVCPDRVAVARYVQQIASQITRDIIARRGDIQQRIEWSAARMDRWRETARERVARLSMRLNAQEARLRRDVGQWSERIKNIVQHIHALHPKTILRRGYSYTTDASGRIIKRAAELRVGDSVSQVYSDGRADMRVERL